MAIFNKKTGSNTSTASCSLPATTAALNLYSAVMTERMWGLPSLSSTAILLARVSMEAMYNGLGSDSREPSSPQGKTYLESGS